LTAKACTIAYYAQWAAEPIPLGRRAARKDDLESVAARLEECKW